MQAGSRTEAVGYARKHLSTYGNGEVVNEEAQSYLMQAMVCINREVQLVL